VPSSPGYKRDYKQEAKTDRARGGVKKRALRNKGRRAAIKTGKAEKGDGKDIGHVKALKGTSLKGHKKGSKLPTLRTKVQSASKNRSHGGRIGNTAGKARGGRKGKSR